MEYKYINIYFIFLFKHLSYIDTYKWTNKRITLTWTRTSYLTYIINTYSNYSI